MLTLSGSDGSITVEVIVPNGADVRKIADKIAGEVRQLYGSHAKTKCNFVYRDRIGTPRYTIPEPSEQEKGQNVVVPVDHEVGIGGMFEKVLAVV